MKRSNQEHWRQKPLAEESLFQLLEKIDREFAEQTRQGGCRFCNFALHRADYERKPRGGPQWDKRLSFCCGREGCRRRNTPASVRFLGRRVYAGVIVVLVSAMLQGASAKRIQRLRQVLPIDRRTLERWRKWWLENFVRTGFWRAARALFMPPLCEGSLPRCLVQRFEIKERRERLPDLLKFLAPLSVPEAPESRVL